MADIVIRMLSIGPDDTGDGILYSGVARCSGMTAQNPSINWWVNLNANTIASSITTSIKDAAVNAAIAAGYVVGALDKKTLIGAIIDL